MSKLQRDPIGFNRKNRKVQKNCDRTAEGKYFRSGARWYMTASVGDAGLRVVVRREAK